MISFRELSCPFLICPSLFFLPLSLFISVSLCYFKLLLHSPFICFSYFCSSSCPFFPFSFLLNSSLFLTFNVCLHILILMSVLFFECFFSNAKAPFSLHHYKILPPSLPASSMPPFMLCAPLTIFIVNPLQQPCPQPFQPSFPLAISFRNILQ